MRKTFDILLIDDHPIIIDAYKASLTLFNNQNDNYTLKLTVAYCCESAMSLINNRNSNNGFDVVFLDIRLPPTKDGKIKSGEQLGVLIKKKFITTKIIVITGHYDVLMLSNIFNNINPEALLYKGDIESSIISKALMSVINDIPFYSSSVLQLLRKKMSSNIILTKTDKQLLYELSKGTKTKDLTKILPLSIGGVEKRKRHLKDIFNSSKKDDETLISSAIEKGFL